MKRICKCCGAEFETEYKRRWFCNECRAKYSRRMLYVYAEAGGRPEAFKRKCTVCGKEFETRNPRRVTCGAPDCMKERKRKKDIHCNKVRQESGYYQSKVDEFGSWENWENVRDYIAMKKHEDAVRRNQPTVYHKVCIVCGKCFDTTNPMQKACSQDCSKRFQSQRKQHRIPESQIIDKDITLEALYRRDKGICYLCGCKCNWDDKTVDDAGYTIVGDTYPTIEHVFPVSRGGMHSWDNIRLACRKCNCAKSNTVNEEIRSMLPDPRIARSVARKVAPVKKPVEQYSKDGNLLRVYESTAEAERETGIKQRGIQNNARGETKTYKGYIWKYTSAS